MQASRQRHRAEAKQKGLVIDAVRGSSSLVVSDIARDAVVKYTRVGINYADGDGSTR